MKKAIIYWFTMLAILLIASSCSVFKKNTKTAIEETAASTTNTNTEKFTKTNTENFIAEPIDNTKPMQLNDRYFYNTKVIYTNEKKEENENENTNKTENTETKVNVSENEKTKQFVFKDIYFLYLFLGFFAFKLLQKYKII